MALEEQSAEKKRARGLEEGGEAMLLEILRRRFGMVPLEVEQRIRTADRKQFLRWRQRIFEVRSLDVFLESDRH